MASISLPPDYSLRRGSGLERARLVKFMQRTYAEIAAGGNYSHLAKTVEQYLSQETPLWWVELANPRGSLGTPPSSVAQQQERLIACLWLGTAVDQVQGDRHSHIFLLYVVPEHRRKGIGSALMRYAEDWARARGDRKIGLQVFQANQVALNLYRNLGYRTQSLWMIKLLEEIEGEE